MQEEIILMNSKSTKQKVATGTISSFDREHKFHFNTFPDTWYKVDVQEALGPSVNFIFQILNAEEKKMKDAVETSAVWDMKYMNNAL